MLDNPQPIAFASYRLDVSDARLWDGDAVVALTPKAFSVLHYLAARPGRLVTKQELLDVLWADAVVGDAVLKVAVREVRRALGDDPKVPRFIETAHRRGYRFVASIQATALDPAHAGAVDRSTVAPSPAAAVIVGRDTALARLRAQFAAVQSGQRRIVFVTGEPGIGKTTLLDALLDDLLAEPRSARVGRGHCVEHYGAGEPYLPVLQAIGEWFRDDPSADLLDAMLTHAPTWVAQLPALLERVSEDRVRRETAGATRERMLREIAEALEVIARSRPVVLGIEDLHWSDAATLELLALLARRRGDARILVIGTWRPTDVSAGDPHHRRLLTGILGQSAATEIQLGSLDCAAVADYLRVRFPTATIEDWLVTRMHECTGGHPLFLAHACDHLQQHHLLDDDPELDAFELGVPHALRALIEHRLDALEPQAIELLDAASVIGFEFRVDVIAAVLDRDAGGIEDLAERLEREHGLLRSLSVAVDGPPTARYSFRHALVQDVCYERITAARRARLHLAVAVQIEQGEFGETEDRGAALARHFEAGRAPDRAFRQLLRAAETCVRRSDNDGALRHLRRAEELLRQLPTGTRLAARRSVLERAGAIERSSGDMAAAAATFDRLTAAAGEAGDAEAEAMALLLSASATFWLDRTRCAVIIARAAAVAGGIEDPVLRDHVLGWCGHWNLTLRGWRAEDAAALDRAVDTTRAAGRPELLRIHLVRAVYSDMLRCDYQRAARRSVEGAELALEHGDRFDQLLALFFRAWTLIHAGGWRRALLCIGEGVDAAVLNGHESWNCMFGVMRAQLAQQAFDHDAAIAGCAPALERARSRPDAAGQLEFHGSIVVALAELGRGRVAAAQRRLAPLARIVETDPMEMDWMLHLPLRVGLALSHLHKGRSAAVRDEAVRIGAQAQASGERTYLGLAEWLQAEAAALDGDDESARQAIERGLEHTDDEATPLAAWRLHAVALRVSSGRAAVVESRRRAVTILQRLAAELESVDPALAATMRSSQEYRAVGATEPARAK